MQEFVELVKLDRHPNQPRPTRRDKRCKHCLEAWRKTEEMLQAKVDSGEIATIGKIIANESAPATGFFSVWMTVFSQHHEMRRGFINAFPGTAPD